jgi:methyltransferase (TIGR00027 family)
MDTGGSKTAMLVAAYRGRAASRTPRLCNDPWAARLAGEEGLELARRFDGAFAHAELWITLRTAALDQQVRRFTREHACARQVVILGAGLDTRAARLAEKGVRFFEVDHPESQAVKLARLGALEGYPVGAATYVSCDFEREDFLTRLAASGFDASEPALVVWEGVVYYLTEEAVRGTLRRVASGCHPETVIVLDYLGKKLVHGQVKDPRDLAASHVVTDLGEPLLFGLDDPVPLFSSEGFRHLRTISFDQICLAHTGTYERARQFRFQHVAAASRDTEVTL